MESIYESAGARIKELRIRKGYSREKLAEKACISTKFLYEIETGKKGFSADTLFRISNVLAVKCDYILCGGEEPEQQKDLFYNEELALFLEWFGTKKKGRLVELMKVVYCIANDA